MKYIYTILILTIIYISIPHKDVQDPEPQKEVLQIQRVDAVEYDEIFEELPKPKEQPDKKQEVQQIQKPEIVENVRILKK